MAADETGDMDLTGEDHSPGAHERSVGLYSDCSLSGIAGVCRSCPRGFVGRRRRFVAPTHALKDQSNSPERSDYCLVNEPKGWSVAEGCGNYTNPCATIQDCLVVLTDCCSGSAVTILVESDLTTSGGNSSTKYNTSQLAYSHWLL